MTAHLWQSTLFAGFAALLALIFRKQRAGIRYWIWMAASLKFLIPFAVLIEIGTRIPWPAAVPVARPHLTLAAPDVTLPLAGQRFLAPGNPVRPANTGVADLIMFAIWIVGAAVVLFFWAREWRRMRRIVRAGKPLLLSVPFRAVSVPRCHEPGVVGILRPTLLLPEGIASNCFRSNCTRSFCMSTVTSGAETISPPFFT